MSTPYETGGRTSQKRRTREALVAAARGLIADGSLAPTVEQAAGVASVSRTTAYRYFPSQRALVLAAHPETRIESLLPEGIGDDPAERLAAAVRRFTELVIDTEPQLRTTLRLSLGTGADPARLPLRQGRAVAWFRDALAPLVPTLSEQEVTRLAVVVRSAVGIEALVWLTDVAGLDRKTAAELMQWAALALLHRALEDPPPL